MRSPWCTQVTKIPMYLFFIIHGNIVLDGIHLDDDDDGNMACNSILMFLCELILLYLR